MTRERVFMQILKYPVRLWMKIVFNPKLIKNELKDTKKPVLIIGNHVTFEDPILAMSYTKMPISYLAASINMDDPFKNFIFRVFKVIPFTKGQMDIKAIRKLRKYVNKKSVGLYPEGARSWDGSNIDIIHSISSLVKLLNVDVYSVNLYGFYFIKPRWAKKYRRGHTSIEVKKVMSAEDIKQMSPSEILKNINGAICYNEYDNQRKDPHEYTGRLIAESIEKVLYKCPSCGAVDTLTSKDNIFWCTECEKEYGFDKYGFITGCDKFDNPHDWNMWQKEYVDEIYDNMMPIVNKNVKASIIQKDKNVIEKVDVTFDKDGITLGGHHIDAKEIKSPNLVFTDVLEFFIDDGKVRLKLNPKKHSSFILLEDLVKKIVASN